MAAAARDIVAHAPEGGVSGWRRAAAAWLSLSRSSRDYANDANHDWEARERADRTADDALREAAYSMYAAYRVAPDPDSAGQSLRALAAIQETRAEFISAELALQASLAVREDAGARTRLDRIRNENGFRILEGPRRTGDGYYEFVTLDPDLNRIEVTTGPTSSDPACPDNTPLSLKLIDVDLAICRLSADDPFPEWAGYGELVSLTRSEDELSVVCPSVRVPDGVASEKGWRAFVVEGPLGFELTGILASLTAPLAEQRISVFAISTYDTDYLLVKKEMVREAMLVLGRRCEILSTNEQLGKPEPGAP